LKETYVLSFTERWLRKCLRNLCTVCLFWWQTKIYGYGLLL